MSFGQVATFISGIIFIILLYVIIYYALKIMYKDVKNGNKRRSSVRRKSFGLEVIESVSNSDLKAGSVVPIRGEVTIGRKQGNSLIIPDQHVSGQHAKIFIKNNTLYIEDLNSTNGTFINGERINSIVKLFPKDEIKVGSTKLRVLG